MSSKNYHKGNVTNALVRCLLENVSGKFKYDYNKDRESVDKKYKTCIYCENSLKGETLQIEHLFGMNKNEFGLHVIENIALACKKHNSSYNKKTYEEKYSMIRDKHKGVVKQQIKKYKRKYRKQIKIAGKICEDALRDMNKIMEKYMVKN